VDKAAFLNHLEGLLEIETGSLTGDERLDRLNGWDSLAAVSFIALADAQYGKAVTAGSLSKAQTVMDLMKLVSS
jgi:acyl carrier protein